MGPSDHERSEPKFAPDFFTSWASAGRLAICAETENVAACTAGQTTPVSFPQAAQPSFGRKLLTVRDSAVLLGVSQSWVRRHVRELPTVRIGRLVRFDSALLQRQFQGKYSAGNRLKPEGVRQMSLRLRRYQRGYVYKTGKRIKTWYGMFREDIPQPDGQVIRRQRNVRLGTLTEFPTRATAYEELSRLMGRKSTIELTFAEIVERWKVAVVPTLKNTTATCYLNTIRARVIPVFGRREVSNIGRYDVETFLAKGAQVYCRNTLRGMRASLGRVLSWAVACGWLEKNPCSGVKLPHAGKKITRTILKPDETIAIANRLSEPYSTLVLFLAVSGLRISEAIGIKWTDFDGDVLHISRRIYDGKEGTTKTESSERSLPIPKSLLARMRLLGKGEWVFRSRTGTPVNPGNALKRYIRPVARELGIAIGGWHDFRHTLNTRLRKRGWSARVRADILGHSSLEVTEQIYDHADGEDFRAALGEIENELLRDVTKLHQDEAAAKGQPVQ